MTTNNNDLQRILSSNLASATTATEKEFKDLGVDTPTPTAFGARLAMNLAAANMASALKRINELESQLAGVEERAMRFRGVHQSAEEYRRGDLVTHAGALWHCNRATTDRPGDGGTGWQLAVKSGGAA